MPPSLFTEPCYVKNPGCSLAEYGQPADPGAIPAAPITHVRKSVTIDWTGPATCAPTRIARLRAASAHGKIPSVCNPCPSVADGSQL